jgi:hypothetical protein
MFSEWRGFKDDDLSVLSGSQYTGPMTGANVNNYKYGLLQIRELVGIKSGKAKEMLKMLFADWLGSPWSYSSNTPYSLCRTGDFVSRSASAQWIFR